MMTSQLEFDPGNYHLRVMIEQMEREGRSEHAIEDAVRAASDWSPAAEALTTEHCAGGMGGRSFHQWVQHLRPSRLPRTGGAARCPRV
jgi:hypothetical protein